MEQPVVNTYKLKVAILGHKLPLTVRYWGVFFGCLHP